MASKFAGNEKLWLDYFTIAWKIATQNSFEGELVYLDQLKREKEQHDKNWEVTEDDNGCGEMTNHRSCRNKLGCKWGKVKVTSDTKALAQGASHLEGGSLENTQEQSTIEDYLYQFAEVQTVSSRRMKNKR